MVTSGAGRPVAQRNAHDAELADASHPRQPGWYQIRTAGDSIIGAPKRIISPLRNDVNDFMIAVLDPAECTLMVRVSSND
jgi:hypothetical protein